MDKVQQRRGRFLFLSACLIVTFFVLTLKMPMTSLVLPNPHRAAFRTATDTITPLHHTRHLLVSAYMDERVRKREVRIIGIFRRDSIQPLNCLFICQNDVLSSTTPASILQHSDNFGFPYATTDILCDIPNDCQATHVTLLSDLSTHGKTFLPIKNQQSGGQGPGYVEFNFTVCISNLFGNYNNVLQFAQTMEMYRLLGVNRVVIYNTSSGPDLNRLLWNYSKEGFLEIVPWAIDQHLKPSTGWLFSQHGGDVHYYGQLTTLNECIYRNMYRSRYVMLNDLDEIIMPYKHDNLMALMEVLQSTHSQAGVFLIENHIFPKTVFDKSGKFHLPQWNGVPGVNILEHTYKEEPDRKIYHPHKMIVLPRSVVQTSVHDSLQIFGGKVKVPPDVCRIIHVRGALRGLPMEQLSVDERLLHFKQRLIPRVDEVLRMAGMLHSSHQS